MEPTPQAAVALAFSRLAAAGRGAVNNVVQASASAAGAAESLADAARSTASMSAVGVTEMRAAVSASAIWRRNASLPEATVSDTLSARGLAGAASAPTAHAFVRSAT